MPNKSALLHVPCTSMVVAGAALVPGSFCLVIGATLMAVAFAMGSRGASKEGDAWEPPLVLVAYLAAGWLGAIANLAFMFFVGHK